MRRFRERRGSISRTIAFFLMAAALVLTGCTSGIKGETGKGYHQIVVLSDVHIPGNNLPVKEKALQTVNSWNDVDMVVVTGDIVATGGSPEEFAAARSFFSKAKQEVAHHRLLSCPA